MILHWASEIRDQLIISLVTLLLGITGVLFRPFWIRTWGWVLLGGGLCLLVLALIFFRDPERNNSFAKEIIVAPADGKVFAVEDLKNHADINGPAKRIAIFMNLGNVHVQRTPFQGKLVAIKHLPGKFLPAFHLRAAQENEQCWYLFKNPLGSFVLVQIAGLIARRTRSWIKPGEEYQRGTRLGMIMYGSEVDVYFPAKVKIDVKPGDQVIAGKTPLGTWKP